MTPPIFSIGDQVEIIGPSAVGTRIGVGEKFTISEILMRADSEAYSDSGHSWYPASSLRLVEEELKIGDWVEVIGPTRTGGNHDIGGLFRISHKTLSGEYEGANDWTGKNFGWYHTKSLRKLTPEEIEAHLHPVRISATMDCSKFLAGMEKCQDKLWKIGIEARLSAIEHRQGAQQNRQNEAREYSDNLYKITEKLAERIYDLQKQLEFVEAFQKDAAYTTYTYNTDDPARGTITVHCSCGQKYEIEATPRTYGED